MADILEEPKVMDAVIGAGFPKAGNTMLGTRNRSCREAARPLVAGGFREAGHLDQALRSFSDRELVICPVQAIAGSWSQNILSWSISRLDLHTVRHEDFIRDKDVEIRKLATFLEVDGQVLALGFQDQQDSVVQMKEDTSVDSRSFRVFYNRAASNYFVEFFDRSSVRTFIDRHWAVLSACGYGDWC